MAQRVNVVARIEIDSINEVDNIAQEKAREETIERFFEHFRDGLPFVRAVQHAQFRQEIIAHELDEVFARAPLVLIRRPIAPAITLGDNRFVGLTAHHRVLFAAQFEIVIGFEKEHPGKLRQAVEVAVQSRVLAHNVACGFNDG